MSPRYLDASWPPIVPTEVLSPVIPAPETWSDAALLIPHEVIRHIMDEMVDVLSPKYFDLLKRPDKLDLFFDWFEGMVEGFTHTHHHGEEDTYFPWVLSRALLPQVLTEQHGQLEARMHGIAGYRTRLKAVLTEAAGHQASEELRELVKELRQEAAEFRKLMWEHLDAEEEIIPPLLVQHFTAKEEEKTARKMIEAASFKNPLASLETVPMLFERMDKWAGPAWTARFFETHMPRAMHWAWDRHVVKRYKQVYVHKLLLLRDAVAQGALPSEGVSALPALARHSGLPLGASVAPLLQLIRSPLRQAREYWQNRQRRKIVVCGVTGLQGRSVANFLLRCGQFRVVGITRDFSSENAIEMSRRGVELVKADYLDPRSLQAAFRGAYGVFAMTDYWNRGGGEDGELIQGKNIAQAVKSAGVEHLVFSSLDRAAHELPHFRTKVVIEDYIRYLGIPSTFVITSIFVENLLGRFIPMIDYNDPEMLVFNTAGDPELRKPYQVIGDLGGYVREIFLKPEYHLGKSIGLVTEYLSDVDVVDIFQQVTGSPMSLRQIEDDDPLLTLFPEFEVYTRVASEYYARSMGTELDPRSLELSRMIYPGAHSLREWLQITGFDGRSKEAEQVDMPDRQAEQFMHPH